MNEIYKFICGDWGSISISCEVCYEILNSSMFFPTSLPKVILFFWQHYWFQMHRRSVQLKETQPSISAQHVTQGDHCHSLLTMRPVSQSIPQALHYHLNPSIPFNVDTWLRASAAKIRRSKSGNLIRLHRTAVVEQLSPNFWATNTPSVALPFRRPASIWFRSDRSTIWSSMFSTGN